MKNPIEKIAKGRRDFDRNLFLHLLFKRFQGIDLVGNPEVIEEEKRKYDQARLARHLKIVDKYKFLGTQSSKANSSDKKKSRERFISIKKKSAPLELQIEEEHRVIRLTDVTILPKVGGQTFVGTLEAHVNGFIYKASSFHMHYYFDDISRSFFRLGDKRMPPLLHFHLKNPIVMGTVKTKDIEFHLVQCPLGQMRSDHDSDEIEKEKQIRVGDLNKDLKNFIDKVDARWNSQCRPMFGELIKEYEFYGVLPSKASAAFALTLFHLIVFVETPFVVVPLREIEIVNLAMRRRGKIDMTVIFNDFKVDNVLEINSIPSESLAAIKHRLNNSDVKYYVNAKKLNWKDIVKHITDFPKKFIDHGGWDYFELEDRDTLAYYMENTDFPKKKVIENGGWNYFKVEDSGISAYCREIAFAPEYVRGLSFQPRVRAYEKLPGRIKEAMDQIVKKLSYLVGKLHEADGNLDKIQDLIAQEGMTKFFEPFASSEDAAYRREMEFAPVYLQGAVGLMVKKLLYLVGKLHEADGNPDKIRDLIAQEGMTKFFGPFASSAPVYLLGAVGLIVKKLLYLEGKLLEANGNLEKENNLEKQDLIAQKGVTKFFEGSEDACAKAVLTEGADPKLHLELYSAEVARVMLQMLHIIKPRRSTSLQAPFARQVPFSRRGPSAQATHSAIVF